MVDAFVASRSRILSPQTVGRRRAESQGWVLQPTRRSRGCVRDLALALAQPHLETLAGGPITALLILPACCRGPPSYQPGRLFRMRLAVRIDRTAIVIQEPGEALCAALRWN